MSKHTGHTINSASGRPRRSEPHPGESLTNEQLSDGQKTNLTSPDVERNPIPSPYLSSPATSNGTLVLGAGTNPHKGAYNIDIAPIHSAVHGGDATDLSHVLTGSQAKIIIENPYGFDPLHSEIQRVLKRGGVIEITGGDRNPWIRGDAHKGGNIPPLVDRIHANGWSFTQEAVPNDGQFKTIDGKVILSPRAFKKFNITID